jgi:putative membrane protein
MVNFIIKYLLIAVAIMVGAKYIDGIAVNSFQTSLYVALAMGFVNTFIKPVLKFVSFPITIVTLGLFALVINVIMVYVVKHYISGFTVHGFIPPLIFSFGISLVNSVLSWFFSGKDD